MCGFVFSILFSLLHYFSLWHCILNLFPNYSWFHLYNCIAFLSVDILLFQCHLTFKLSQIFSCFSTEIFTWMTIFLFLNCIFMVLLFFTYLIFSYCLKIVVKCPRSLIILWKNIVKNSWHEYETILPLLIFSATKGNTKMGVWVILFLSLLFSWLIGFFTSSNVIAQTINF